MTTPDGDDQQPPAEQPPSYPPPGYQAHGYQAPGYPPPSYPPPGYAPPVYGAPGYPPPGYGPPQPGAPWGVDQYGRPYSDKSKIVAGVLQLLLGEFGAGRWYTGHYGIAVAQLLTCGGLGIWALIDGIMMLVGNVNDSQGRPLHG
jgi:TM2 domain-containing membrane protein YozV